MKNIMNLIKIIGCLIVANVVVILLSVLLLKFFLFEGVKIYICQFNSLPLWISYLFFMSFLTISIIKYGFGFYKNEMDKTPFILESATLLSIAIGILVFLYVEMDRFCV